MDGIVEVVRSLRLYGPVGTLPLPDARVYKRLLPFDLNLDPPCIVVSLSPIPETLEAGTNAADDYGYPVWVTIVLAQNQSVVLSDSGVLEWRQKIRNAFHNQQPDAMIARLGVPLHKCTWEPAPVIDKEAFDRNNLFASAAVIRTHTRELRGA